MHKYKINTDTQFVTWFLKKKKKIGKMLPTSVSLEFKLISQC